MKLLSAVVSMNLSPILLYFILFSNTVFGSDLNNIIRELQQQDWGGAIAAADRMSQTQPENSTLYFLRGVARYQQGDYRASREDLSRALELGKVSGEVYFYRGIDNLYLKDYKNSVKDFTTTLRDNNSAQKLTNFSALLKRKDDTRQCLANIYTFRALAYLNSGKYQEGLADINQAFSISVTLSYSSYKIKADLQFLNNQYKQAYSNYLKSVELNPSNSDSYYGAGLIEIYFGNYNKALKYLRKAQNLDPNNDDTVEKIGLCQLFSNNLNEALQTFLDSYNSSPNAYNSLYLGYTYASLGNSEKAAKYYRQAILLNTYIPDIMKIIYNKLPVASPTRLQQQKILNSIEDYIQHKLQPELKITDIALKPEIPHTSQNFHISIGISALFPAAKSSLQIPLHFIISKGEKTLFTSETRTLIIANGKSGEWIEQMNGVPVSGDFTLTVITALENISSRRQLEFTITNAN